MPTDEEIDEAEHDLWRDTWRRSLAFRERLLERLGYEEPELPSELEVAA